MLAVKRTLTGCILFPFCFLVIYLGTMMFGGAISGVIAKSKHPEVHDFESGYKVGYQAGVEFRKTFGTYILLGALGISAAIAIGIPCSRALPWCREETSTDES